MECVFDQAQLDAQSPQSVFVWFCKTLYFNQSDNFCGTIFHIHKKTLYLLLLYLPLFWIHTLSKKSGNIFSLKYDWVEPFFKKKCVEINLKCSERRTVNIICSLDLQYCLCAKNQEWNTRGMLLGFVLHLAPKERVLVAAAISPSTSNPLWV